MTGKEFTARYRLREQLHTGPVTTFRAIDSRGGRVFVHVYRDENAPKFDVKTLDRAGTDLVREVLDVEAIQVVVTKEIEPFTSFEEWTASRQRKEEEANEGAYTRIFRIDPDPEPPSPVEIRTNEPPRAAPPTMPEPRFDPPRPAPPTIPEPRFEPPRPAPPIVAEAEGSTDHRGKEIPTADRDRGIPGSPPPDLPGEYTRLFNLANEASPPPAPKPPAFKPPPPPPPAPPPPPPDALEHGTYSRIMTPGTPIPTPPRGAGVFPSAPPPPPIERPREPAPPPSPLPPVQPYAPPPSAPFPPVGRAPEPPQPPSAGAYTMIMRATGPTPEPPPPRFTPQAPPPPPTPRSQPMESGLYADNYLGRLRDPGPEVTPHALPAPPERPLLDRSLYEPPPQAEGGSYTMIIGRGAAPAPPPPRLEGAGGFPVAPPPPPPPPQAASKPPSKTPLIVAMVLIGAILLTLLLFLILRPDA